MQKNILLFIVDVTADRGVPGAQTLLTLLGTVFFKIFSLPYFLT